MSKILQQDYKEYSKLIEEGHSQRSACLILGLNRSTIQRYIKGVLEDETNGVIEQYLEIPSKDDDTVENNQPKICYLDIEKSFNISGHFGAWSQNLRQEAKFRESHILSYCYTFNDDVDIKGSIIPAKELKDDFVNCLVEGKVHTTIDELLVLELWALFNNSDVIVAYNGRGFDIKEIQARFLMYGLPPTSPVKVIDPLLIVKDKFRLPFKSLKYVAEFLGVTEKLENCGYVLW